MKLRKWYWAGTLAMLVGVWGCSRNSGQTALLERIQSLEAKTIRLEEDFRSAAAQRDQFKKKLIVEEDARSMLQTEVEKLQVEVKDLHDTKRLLAQRTQERDQLLGQYESFRKNLQDILGQTDTAMQQIRSGNAPGVSAIPTSGLKQVPVQFIPGRPAAENK